jgi:hypothetical protein
MIGRMFEHLVHGEAIADGCDAAIVDAIAGWTRAEAIAASNRLSAIAELTERRLGSELADERERWACDAWDSAAAEIAAACGLSHRVASGQMHQALALRHRLPEVAKMMAKGELSAKAVNTIAWRTQLIDDPEVIAKVDTELAAAAGTFGPMSTDKLETAIDAAVERHDPSAVYAFTAAAKGCDLGFGKPDDTTGVQTMWARFSVTDAELLKRRIAALVAVVCPHDPRSAGERRTQAVAVIAANGTSLPCPCGREDCAAAGPDARADAVVIHVIADQLPDAGPAPHPDAGPAPGPDAGPAPEPAPGPEAPKVEPEPVQAQPDAEPPVADGANSSDLTAEPVPAQAAAASRSPRPGLAVIAGGGIVPTPLLAQLIALGAKVRPIAAACELGAEPHYRPSAKLARFVRSRDVTCCFLGCTKPAEYCDVDHTIAHGVGGLTHPGNTKCLCRKHHLLKTFWTGPGGWSDQQLADGTVVWISPTGHRYTRPSGSRLLFAHWDTTTPLPEGTALPDGTAMPPRRNADAAQRGLTMPLRKTTRAKATAQRRRAQRKRHQQALDDDAPPL